MRRLVPFVLAATLWTTGASAQGGPILVLPVSVGHVDAAGLSGRAAEIVSSAERAELSFISSEVVRQRFERVGSRDAPTIDAAATERWLTLAHDAVRHLARAEHAEARALLVEAERELGEAGALVARDPALARRALDVCLYHVRALLETGDPEAEARVMACRRRHPILVAPTPYQHPPEVVELLGRVDAALFGREPVALEVLGAGAGCAVRVNGVELGASPEVRERLLPGDYDVQVECDASPGRVHTVRLEEGAARVTVDARLDDVVRTAPSPQLAYERQAQSDERRFEDSLALAQVVGAAEVWLLEERGAALRIDRVAVAERRVVASVRFVLSRVADAMRDLLARRSMDHTSDPAVAMAVWLPFGQEVPILSRTARSEAEIVAGTVLGALALGSAVAGCVMQRVRFETGERLGLLDPDDEPYLGVRDSWLNLRIATWGLAGATAVLGTTAVALVMHEERGAPWWSWVLGGVGLVATAVGAVVVATAELCPDNIDPGLSCVDQAGMADGGALTMGAGVPLMAVPLTYLLRELGAWGAQARIEASGDGVMLGVAGEL